MKNEMEVEKVDESSRISALIPAKMYNDMADYVNKNNLFNMSTGLRQAIAFFLQKKTSKDN